MGKWFVLILLSVSQFIMVLDSTVMNVSISTVAHDLGTDISGMQAAITFYALTMALTLVYCGEHYVVDVTMGAIVATYGWFAAGTWLRIVGPLLRSRAMTRARNVATGQPMPAD